MGLPLLPRFAVFLKENYDDFKKNYANLIENADALHIPFCKN